MWQLKKTSGIIMMPQRAMKQVAHIDASDIRIVCGIYHCAAALSNCIWPPALRQKQQSAGTATAIEGVKLDLWPRQAKPRTCKLFVFQWTPFKVSWIVIAALEAKRLFVYADYQGRAWQFLPNQITKFHRRLPFFVLHFSFFPDTAECFCHP